MAVYKYRKNFLGASLKGYENEREYYNIYTTKDGLTVSTKKGKTLHYVASTDNNKILIHTIDNAIVVEEFDKALKKSNFSVYIGDKLIKNATISGKVDEIILGSEDVYFKKFDKYQGNRIYYRLYRSNDIAITPPWQHFNHEIGPDEKDRFYCKNYRELSRDEFLEEDDLDYENNLAEDAVYLSDGHVLFEQQYTEEYELEIAPLLKSLNNNIVLGSVISITNPVIGSAVMLTGLAKEISDSNKENNNISENKPSETNTNNNSTNNNIKL
ncbi:MAG: hypothetical protein IJ008_00350 [Clostridia bacterium]|nr:hypothetical protein [Clostridia bacterium]